MPPSNELDLEELVRIPSVLSFDYSTKNNKVAYASNVSGRWEIYLKDLYSPLNSEALCITTGSQRKTAPSFSRNGRYIAYLQDFNGNENFDILIYDIENASTVNITNSPDIAILPGVSWSPDDETIAFVSNQDGTFATYSIPAQGGPITRLTNHSYSDGEVEISPDGRFLAVSAQTEGLDSGLFIVNLIDGSEREIKIDDKRIDASNPQWSPDGRYVAFESNSRGSYNLALYDLNTHNVRWLSEGDWDTTQARFSPDGNRLAFVINRDSNLELGVLNLNSSESKYYQVLPGVYSSPHWSGDGSSLLFRYVGPRNPSDLWILNFETGSSLQLTNSLSADFPRNLLVEPQVIRYPSRKQNMKVPALLYQPKGQTTPTAAVVYIHGGPTAQQLNGWAADIQYLVSRGFVVLCPNYRGSTGYGKAWQDANIHDLGIGDLADVMGGVDYLLKENLAVKGRIAVTGGSYGGYMTMMAITKFPDEWAAAVSIVPFLNWFTEYENEREDLKYYDSQMMGDPVKDEQRWYEVSPINFFSNIKTPVLLLAGANDPRCPADETQQAIEKLSELGKTFDAHIYPDEGHGFARVENRINAIRRQVEYLERYCPIGK